MAEEHGLVQATTVNKASLGRRGFVLSGQEYFAKSVDDFSNELEKRAIANAEQGRGQNMPLEVTHDHVRAASHSIFGNFGTQSVSGWAVAGQVGEYICAASAGAAASYLDKQIGIGIFAISCIVGTILIVLRLAKRVS